MRRSVSPWMNTMTRCLLASVFLAPVLAMALPGQAQTTLPAVQTAPSTIPKASYRNFPSHVQYGVLRIEQIPRAEINGKPVRTAPGFRLFAPDNKLIFAHTVQNEALRVAYVREASTQWLLTAWMLTPEEAASVFKKR